MKCGDVYPSPRGLYPLATFVTDYAHATSHVKFSKYDSTSSSKYPNPQMFEKKVVDEASTL